MRKAHLMGIPIRVTSRFLRLTSTTLTTPKPVVCPKKTSTYILRRAVRNLKAETRNNNNKQHEQNDRQSQRVATGSP